MLNNHQKSNLKNKLADMLAYPAWLYQKLTDKKAALYAGIVLVGAIDLLLPDIAEIFRTLFSGRSADDAAYNALAAVLAVLVLGAVDVVFVSMPLFDIFKFLKKREIVAGQYGGDRTVPMQAERPDARESRERGASAIKVMKAYIMSHFIIIPFTTAVYYLFMRNINEISPVWMQNLAMFFFILTFVWSAAILTRAVNVLFGFGPLFRRLTYIIVFTWNFIFSLVFNEYIIRWVFKLFR